MAEVTGFTAERMLEIEQESITNGVIVGSRLKLYTRDGTEIDAGEVVGIVPVFHGTNADFARPAGAPVVYWIGTAIPVNARAWDHHLRENILP